MEHERLEQFTIKLGCWREIGGVDGLFLTMIIKSRMHQGNPVKILLFGYCLIFSLSCLLWSTPPLCTLVSDTSWFYIISFWAWNSTIWPTHALCSTDVYTPNLVPEIQAAWDKRWPNVNHLLTVHPFATFSNLLFPHFLPILLFTFFLNFSLYILFLSCIPQRLEITVFKRAERGMK